MAFDKNSEDNWDGSEHDEPWIKWFCGLKGHEMFCEVERSYIEDGFNLYGLRVCVSNFNDCLDLILDRIGPDEESDDSHLTQSACTLYGLIHARYIITAHGLDAMYSKYAAKEFGTCPLIQCGGQPVLPVSLKDEMGVDTVKIYCPKCSQVFHPPPIRSSRSSSSSSNSNNNNSSISNALAVAGVAGGAGVGMTATTNQSGGADGAAFGTTFPHLFLMTFSNLVPDPLPADSVYVPRIFGFRVHKSTSLSSQQQRQQQQQRFLPSPTTATTNTTNTQAAVETATLQLPELTSNQDGASNMAVESSIAGDSRLNIVDESKPPQNKLPNIKELDGEDHANNDDGEFDNNSQLNSKVNNQEVSTATIPLLLPMNDLDPTKQKDETTSVKHSLDTNGAAIASESSTNKRRRRTTSNHT